jgi:hypothetical protein
MNGEAKKTGIDRFIFKHRNSHHEVLSSFNTAIHTLSDDTLTSMGHHQAKR